MTSADEREEEGERRDRESEFSSVHRREDDELVDDEGEKEGAEFWAAGTGFSSTDPQTSSSSPPLDTEDLHTSFTLLSELIYRILCAICERLSEAIAAKERKKKEEEREVEEKEEEKEEKKEREEALSLCLSLREVMTSSGVMTSLIDYLRNDSQLDLLQRRSLYLGIFSFLSAVAKIPALSSLFAEPFSSSPSSLFLSLSLSLSLSLDSSSPSSPSSPSSLSVLSLLPHLHKVAAAAYKSYEMMLKQCADSASPRDAADTEDLEFSQRLYETIRNVKRAATGEGGGGGGREGGRGRGDQGRGKEGRERGGGRRGLERRFGGTLQESDGSTAKRHIDRSGGER